jgi:HK97 family phage portal protein
VFNWLKRAFKKRLFKNETVDMMNPKLLEWLGIDPDTPKDKLSEATYFACLKILAESLGKLPLKMYQNTEKGIIKSDKMEMYNILKLRPNPYMTSTTFWSTVEMNRNHYGNAYVWCRFQGPQLKDLWIMPSQDVTVIIDDQGILGTKDKIWYRYNDRHTGKIYTFASDEVMHFKTSMTFDGLIGMSVRDILKNTVDGALESQKFMNNLYKTGLTGKAVLEYTGDLDPAARDRLVKGFEQFASGSKNAGKIIPVPLGMKLVPLDIKLTDSQFFELKKYTALQIAAAFGIKPNQINDYEKSSYASAEAQNLAFYVDTLLYILKQYEEEITYKILSSQLINQGYFFKFNVNVILRADIKTQMDSLSTAVQNGIMKPNEARDYLDMPADDYGDVLMANGNYIPLSMLGANYGVKGGEG